jgi:hypothetical protein
MIAMMLPLKSAFTLHQLQADKARRIKGGLQYGLSLSNEA